jgi:hypothetical protein
MRDRTDGGANDRSIGRDITASANNLLINGKHMRNSSKSQSQKNILEMASTTAG